MEEYLLYRAFHIPCPGDSYNLDITDDWAWILGHPVFAGGGLLIMTMFGCCGTLCEHGCIIYIYTLILSLLIVAEVEGFPQKIVFFRENLQHF